MNDTQSFNNPLSSVLENTIPGFDKLESVQRLSEGASQETYRIAVNTSQGQQLLAMRRAAGGASVKASPGHPGLATEALLMQQARLAGVPEPKVLHVLSAKDGLGDGFIMEWLEGVTLGARIVRSPQLETIRPQLAYQCGEIIGRIHSINLKTSGLDQVLGVVSPAEFIDQTWQRYKNFDTAQPMIDYTGRWLMANLPESFSPTLVHNDFRNGNIMCSPTGVVAVLDWELAHIGDPMRDLGWICTNSWRFGHADLPVGGFGHYQDLFAGYESITGIKVEPQRVKFWEVFGSFWWSIGCLGMAQQYRTGPDRTIERPAIGRRSSECQTDCVNLLIPGPVSLVEKSISNGTTLDPDLDMPTADELLISVRDFLRNEVMEACDGRNNFLARVAGNSLDIVSRDLALGPVAREQAQQRLQTLLASDESLSSLSWRLVKDLRENRIALDAKGLTEHLRQTVVNQLAIDQPQYSGFKVAIRNNKETTPDNR